MGNHGFLAVALAYALLVAAVIASEVYRTRRSGPDAMSLFLVIALLQCVLPGVAIFGVLPFVEADSLTANPIFDRILTDVDVTIALTVWALTAWFIVFLHVGFALGRVLLPRRAAEHVPATLTLRVPAVVGILAFGTALTAYSFMQFGPDMLTRYTNLILFRAGFEGLERNALNANAFQLTQTWSWIGVAALFTVREQRGRHLLWLACLLASVLLALAGVSRRALFLPLLLAYLGVVLHTRRWHLRWVVSASLPLLLLVAFGKELMSSIAWAGDPRAALGTFESAAGILLRGASEVGITIFESIGTLLYLDEAPRFGVDHVLSIARRFPDEMLGLTPDFPERIVRVATTAFAGPDEQDIPPGLFGQMWLDFRIFGPVAWGIAFGLQVAVVQYFLERVRLNRQAAIVAAIVMFVVALPVNTGSFDFTFSVDIFALVFALALCVRIERAAAPAPESAETSTTAAPMG